MFSEKLSDLFSASTGFFSGLVHFNFNYEEILNYLLCLQLAYNMDIICIALKCMSLQPQNIWS